MMGKKEEPEDNHRSPSSHHNQKRECFVGHSHKAPWRDDIISACEEVLPKFGLQPWYADDQFEPTKSLRDKVVEMVANARYGIYDLSWWRPDEQSAWKMPQNVLIELGMAIALNRPVLLLRHAGNRASGLSLPTCLDSISQRIVEFSGGPTLKRALEERLPQWLDVPPERAWWARYCFFGERTCTYRESYPQIIQCGQKTIGCHIADGKDIDRPDFRSLIEDELGRYSDISFDYLDALLPTTGYDFQLCTYCQTVRSTPFAIYRITPETTAETFIAIGMSIALEKQFKCEIPKFIFTTDARSVPSLLAGYEVVEAKTTKERQKRLQKFIPVVMRKVRESLWKPELLPFVEFSPHTETSLLEKDQVFFSEDDEEFDNELEIIGAGLFEDEEAALEQLEKDTQSHSNNAQIYKNQGDVAAKLFQYEEAISAYNKAIDLEPDNPAFYYNRGRIYQVQEKYRQALEDFDMTVILNPKYPDARRQRDMLWNMLSSSSPSATSFHLQLKYERQQRSLTQVELAQNLDIDTKTVQRWERGVSLPQHLYRRRLCELFGKNAAEFGLLNNVSNQPQERNEDTQSYSRGNPQLIQARLERGWTQKEVAVFIGLPDSRTVGRWERGRNLPSARFRQKLCQLFNKTEEELGLQYDHYEDIIEDIIPISILGESNEEEDQRHCESVIEQLTHRQLEVLQAFANGLHPSEVVEQLSISAPTVSTHTTVLLSLCRTAWSIEAKERLDYRFLQLKFEKYFEEHDQSEDN